MNATVDEVLQELAMISEGIMGSTYKVVSAVNLGVKVNNGGTVVKTAVSTQAGGPNVVVAI